MLLPDKVPLPSLLVDPAQMASVGQGQVNLRRPAPPLTDAQFLKKLADDKLPGWGHEAKLRVIYLLLCRYVASPYAFVVLKSDRVLMPHRWGRNSKSIDGILSVLQSIERGGYHLTLSYFWVQMVTYHMTVEAKERKVTDTAAALFGVYGQPAAAQEPGTADEEVYSMEGLQLLKESDFAATAPVINFAEFLLRPHCQPLRNALLYNKYDPHLPVLRLLSSLHPVKRHWLFVYSDTIRRRWSTARPPPRNWRCPT